MRQTKKAIAALLAVLTVGGATLSPALAASSVKDTISNVAVTARVSTDASSATAVTTYSRSANEIYAQATVYYWFGTKYYKVIRGNTAYAGGVSATAWKQHGGGEVAGGKGEHRLWQGATHWSTTTTIGKVYENSIIMP